MKLSIIIFTLCILTISSVAQELIYEKGYLVLKGNRIEEGYIKHGSSSWSMFDANYGITTFKATLESKRIKIRKKKDVIGFVIGADSFAIKEHIKVAKRSPTFRKDFVKVLETGKINLYVHESKKTVSYHNQQTYQSFGDTFWYTTYLLCKDGECLNVYDVTEQNERILELIKDDKALVTELRKEDPEDWEIRDLVKMYNTGE